MDLRCVRSRAQTLMDRMDRSRDLLERMLGSGMGCRGRVAACASFGFVAAALGAEPRLAAVGRSFASDRCSCLDIEPAGTSSSAAVDDDAAPDSRRLHSSTSDAQHFVETLHFVVAVEPVVVAEQRLHSVVGRLRWRGRSWSWVSVVGSEPAQRPDSVVVVAVASESVAESASVVAVAVVVVVVPACTVPSSHRNASVVGAELVAVAAVGG